MSKLSYLLEALISFKSSIDSRMGTGTLETRFLSSTFSLERVRTLMNSDDDENRRRMSMSVIVGRNEIPIDRMLQRTKREKREKGERRERRKRVKREREKGERRKRK